MLKYVSLMQTVTFAQALRLSDFSILLQRAFEWDSVSMSIIICLVC